MLNLFGLCSCSSKYKIKPGEVGIEVYNSQILKNRDILPIFNSSPQNIVSNQSLKNIIDNDQTLKPISSFKHDSNTLTEVTGDQYTFLRTIEKSNFQELSTNLKNKKQQFTDPQFPPTNKSLGDDPRLHKAVQKWVRITDIYQKPVFFSDDANPNDVIQGYFYGAGNCYFMSAVSNLARNPSRIKQIFGNTQISQEGIYYVKLFYKGSFKEVLIDDFIPGSSSSTPLFSRPPQGSSQVWVQLLQKAYAKLYGNYKSMNGGLPSQAYYALTGAPTFFYSLANDIQTSNKLWSVVLDAYEKNFCVDFGTTASIDLSKWLNPNHAYTMLGAFQVQGMKLIKLRNPRGQHQWVGRASDYDQQFWKLIQSENKRIIGYEPNKQNDGIFFMIWEDVSTYFALFQICQYKNNANLLSIRSKFTLKNANMFQIQTQGGEVVFSLVEDSQRGNGVDLKSFKYSKSYFVIAKLIKNEKGQNWFKIVKLASKNQFAAHHQRLKLQKGTYIAYCKYQWLDNVDKNASFVVYSDGSIRIKQIKQSVYPQYLQKAFMSIPNQMADFSEVKEKYSYVKRFYGQAGGGYGFYAVRVKKLIKESIQIQINKDQLNKSHLILKKPYKSKGKQKILLRGGDQIIIIFRSKDVVIPQKLNVPELIISVKN